jgi:hypothetical protein
MFLLGKDGVLREPKENALFLLSLEDLYLNYPDSYDAGMSNIHKRNEKLPVLDTTRTSHLRRRFVSCGHFHQGNTEKEDAVNECLEELASREEERWNCPVKNKLVHKPVSGLYALWEALGLKEAFYDNTRGKEYQDLAPEFIWPPKPPEYDMMSEAKTGGHSAPGRLLQITECLLERAAVLVVNVRSVADAVRGAVLATDAMELIGCKTPSETLKALDLKHRFEVFAECYFSGMEYHLSMKNRIDDILRTLEAASRWLNVKRKEDFKLNGLAKILTHLIEILEAHGSFEETEYCRDCLREVHKKIMLRSWERKFGWWSKLLTPFVYYFYFVIHSVRNLLIMIAVWGILSILLHAWASPDKDFLVALSKTAYVAGCALFTEAAGFPDGSGVSPILYFVNFFFIAVGFFHFGVVISLIYSKLSRK